MDSISKPKLHKNVKYALTHSPRCFELCVVSTISNMYQKGISDNYFYSRCLNTHIALCEDCDLNKKAAT